MIRSLFLTQIEAPEPRYVMVCYPALLSLAALSWIKAQSLSLRISHSHRLGVTRDPTRAPSVNKCDTGHIRAKTYHWVRIFFSGKRSRSITAPSFMTSEILRAFEMFSNGLASRTSRSAYFPPSKVPNSDKWW